MRVLCGLMAVFRSYRTMDRVVHGLWMYVKAGGWIDESTDLSMGELWMDLNAGHWRLCQIELLILA